MILYIMRHGTTVWNEKGIIQGRSNNRLSRNGVKKCQNSAEALKNVKIDLIFCSPLMRTVQTANIVNEFHNVRVIKDERLTEIDQGIFTGRKKRSLTEYERELKNKKDPICKIEDDDDIAKRIESFYNEIKIKYMDKTILVISHDAPATYLENFVLEMGSAERKRAYQRNFDNAEFRMYNIN